MEQNKTSKYFKYAIGEIVLVVIGILIALSINNWNQSRKENILAKNYYNRLLSDLKADKAYANRYISRVDSSLVLYDNYRKSYNKPNLSLAEIIQNLGTNDVNTFHIEYKTKTIETLINTGDLQILTPKIIDVITEYNGSKNQIEILARDNNEDVNDLLKNLALKGGVLLNIKNYPNQPELFKKLDFDDRIPDMIIAFESYVIWKQAVNRTSIKELTKINKTADSIIEIIKLELKK
ncbi:hypothetical protein KO504_15120 [Winogradskyella psychrotolerans]|uniref:DUF6090 family protein n=1 Tax=Winogradskyella psychrotolerans TaxID=1344585 RepID=UPI001C07AE32|nr:DUF6090 family protein [Winogradskyella psychrotolerans]MBU2922678.1 hypothetical protein [Winogradskyella psychrotolerans]